MAAASHRHPHHRAQRSAGYMSRLYKQSTSPAPMAKTTTSMITTALELRRLPSSASFRINGYGKAGKGDDIVIESCEFAETFLNIDYLSVVLNIDNDHLITTAWASKFAFKRFCPDDQVHDLCQCGDKKNTMDVMYTLDRRAHFWHERAIIRH